MTQTAQLEQAFVANPSLGSLSDTHILSVARSVDAIADLVPLGTIPLPVGIFPLRENDAFIGLRIEIPGDAVKEFDAKSATEILLRQRLHFAGFGYDRQMKVWHIDGVNSLDLARKAAAAAQSLGV